MAQGSDGDSDGITLAAGGDVPTVRRPGVAAAWRVSRSAERRVRIALAALRCAACVLAALAAVVLVVDQESRVFFGAYVVVARYTSMPSLVFLVIASGVAACYNLLLAARCLVSAARGRTPVGRPLAWAIFAGDQLMAYAAVCAVAVAMEAAAIGKHGQREFGWMQTADLYKKFSMWAGVAIACTIMALVPLVAVAAASAFNLFRLYGDGKAKSIDK